MPRKIGTLKSPDDDFNPYRHLEIAVYQEMLREVRHNHWMHLMAVIASLGIVAGGGVLWVKDKPTEGIITAGFGASSSAFCIRLSKMLGKAVVFSDLKAIALRSSCVVVRDPQQGCPLSEIERRSVQIPVGGVSSTWNGAMAQCATSPAQHARAVLLSRRLGRSLKRSSRLCPLKLL
jgi:hypothetical protein